MDEDERSRRDPATPVLGQPAVPEAAAPPRQPAQQPPPRGDRPPPTRRGPGRRLVVLSVLAAALLGVALGAVVTLLSGRGEPGTDAPQAGSAATVEPVEVTGFDPVGGSGFADDGDGTWSTQTYTSADFGNLKDGAGLLVDLGEAAEVSTVTLPEATAGLEVQLLGGDEPPSDDLAGYTPAEGTTTGQEAVTLSAQDAGAHRYWLVWVTELAATGDGYGAELATPVVEVAAD